jgi:hypothetical protein
VGDAEEALDTGGDDSAVVGSADGTGFSEDELSGAEGSSVCEEGAPGMVLVIKVVAKDGRPGPYPCPSSSEPLLASEIAIEKVDVGAIEVDVDEEVIGGGRITAVLEEVDSAAAELLCVSATLGADSTEDEGGAPEPQSPKPAWQPTPQCSAALPHQPMELRYTCQQGKPKFQKHNLVHHIPATETFRASHAGPGATRAVVRDGATGDRGAVGDLNMMLDAMGELVAMSKATSSVRDGGRKRREGDHQDLDPVSHALDVVD